MLNIIVRYLFCTFFKDRRHSYVCLYPLCLFQTIQSKLSIISENYQPKNKHQYGEKDYVVLVTVLLSWNHGTINIPKLGAMD